MNCTEFAKRLNMSINTFRIMRDTGKLPPYERRTPKGFYWTDEQVDLFDDCRNIADYNRRLNDIDLS